MSQSHLYFQAMMIDETSVPIESVLEGTFIERMDLTCPKLILKMADPGIQLRDDAGLHNGSVLTVGIGDAEGRGKELFQARFVVGSNWPEDMRTVCIEATHESIWKIKQPLDRPHFFIDRTPAEILREIFPELELVAGDFPTRWTYHVNPGSTYAVMLEQMRADIGAAIWIYRDKIMLQPLAGFMSQSPAWTFEYMRPASDNPRIEFYERYEPNVFLKRDNERAYFGWSITEGVSKCHQQAAPAFLPTTPEVFLKNRNVYQVPVMECTLAGQGDLTPGAIVKLELHRETQNGFDESVPYQQLITGVRHYQHTTRYLSVCELGVINEHK